MKTKPKYYWVELHPFYGEMTHLNHKKPKLFEGEGYPVILKFYNRNSTFVGWDNDRVWNGRFIVGDGAKSSKTGRTPKFLNKLGWRKVYFGD